MTTTKFKMHRVLLAILFTSLLFSCGSNENNSNDVAAFIGATIIDGNGTAPIQEGVLLVKDGMIISIGPKANVDVPSGAQVINLEGKFIMPGIINAHGHIGDTKGLQSGQYSKQNVVNDLMLNAHYGVTAINSLGGDREESIEIRDEQDTITLNRSRLFAAGDVVTGSTPEEARSKVDKNAAMNVDFIKIRVDDNLGSTEKMTPEIYEAIIDQANKHGLPVAAHIFYLEDAKALLRLDVKFIAHSVRDKEVDEEFIQLMKDNNAYYCPTLMREVSTFVYESTPDFFEDPFFLNETDTTVISQLKSEDRQQRIRESRSAQLYKAALDIAIVNLKKLSDEGVKIAFGTDAGPPARFQGYFEHKELEMMVDAGLTPEQAIVSCTVNASNAIHQNKIGVLETGRWADFMVLQNNPLDDITNTRSIESVWIGGNRIPR